MVAGQDRRAGRLPRGPSGNGAVIQRLSARHRGRRKPRKLLRILAACAPAAAQGRLFPARRRAAGADRDEPCRHIHRNRQQGRARKGRRLPQSRCGGRLGPLAAPCRRGARCLLQGRHGHLPPAFAKPGSAARTGCRHGKDRGPIRKVVRRLCPQCRSQSARAAGRGARRTRPARRTMRTRSRYRPQALMTAPPPRLGKAAPASFLHEALYFVSGC